MFSGVNKNWALIGAAAVAVLSSVYFLNKSFGSSDLLPALTEEETKDILKDLHEKVKGESARLIRSAGSIRQQIQAQGQDIDENQLIQSYILPHLMKSLSAIQTKVYEHHNVEDYEVEDACNFYSKTNDQIRDIANKIRKIFRDFGADVELDEDEDEEVVDNVDLSLDKILHIIQDLSSILSDKVDEFVKEFKKVHGHPNDTGSRESFQQGMINVTEAAENEALARHGVSSSSFQKAVMANQNNPSVQQALYLMQVSNSMKMNELGMM